MSRRRKILAAVAGTFVLLLLALALTPLLFRGRIEARVKTAIARSINARVDWRSLDLGLLRTFPNFSLRVHDLNVTGVGPFARDTLVSVPEFRLLLDLGSVFRNVRGRGPLIVRSIELQRPRALLLVLENGAANWDIARKHTGAKSTRPFDLSLKRLAITNARIRFENHQTGFTSTIANLDHTLSGDFAKERFTLNARVVADTASVRFAGVPYLSNVRAEIDAQIAADMLAHKFELRDNRIRLNDLLLSGSGSVTTRPDTVDIDVTVKAPRTQFRDILSLVPVVYTHNFADVQTSGTMSAGALVRGRWTKNALPAFAVQAKVENGMFRYPDLPLPARDIALQLRLSNPGGDADRTTLNIERFHVVLGSDPVDGALVVRTPRSDPDISLRVNGRVDLANVPRTVKLDSVKELSGIVVANATMRARMSDVNQKRYGNVSASGGMEIRQMVINAADLRQPLRIDNAALRFTPSHAELTSFQGRAGSSDLTMTGTLDNLLGFVLHQEDLRGTATVSSHHFDLNEWRSNDELKSIAVPGRIDFALRASADTVNYGQLTLRNARGSLRIKDRRASLEDFRMEMLGGAMTVTGFYETIDTVHPMFDASIDFNQVDIPAAFKGLRTVQMFAPVARYAQGNVTAKLSVSGALGADMMPVYSNLSALGSLLTNGLVLKGFPPLDRLAEALKVQQLRDPGFIDLKSSFAIEKGRLNVRPFDVRTGPVVMNIAGSNGIDQTLDYTVKTMVPLKGVDSLALGARVTGTITNPRVTTTFRETIKGAVQHIVGERVDSAALLAKQKIVAEAEKRAAEIRAEAASLADKLRKEGHLRADSLEARATGLKRIAAKLAADKLRKETDAKADAIVREADGRAQALVDEARKRAAM